MIVIGLTGSIGMGKSAAAAMLRQLGIAAHEADDEVHKLLSPGGAGALALTAEFPYFRYPHIYGRKDKNGHRPIDRKKLGKIIFNNDKARLRLEAILHPLVRESQADFIRKQGAMGRDIVVLDIPLLFETGGESRVDYIITVSAPYFIQRMRVLSRSGMDEKKFHAILERQTPDAEKRARADFIVHTGLSRGYTMKQLKAIIRDIRARQGSAEENNNTHE